MALRLSNTLYDKLYFELSMGRGAMDFVYSYITCVRIKFLLNKVGRLGRKTPTTMLIGSNFLYIFIPTVKLSHLTPLLCTKPFKKASAFTV